MNKKGDNMNRCNLSKEACEHKSYLDGIAICDTVEYRTKCDLNTIKIGDKVVMNNRYVVAESNINKIFTVRSQPFDICGTECVMLEGYKGGYALDGLTVA